MPRTKMIDILKADDRSTAIVCGSDAVIAWFVTLIWWAIAAVLVFQYQHAVAAKRDSLLLFAVVFPVAGLMMLATVITRTIQWLRFSPMPAANESEELLEALDRQRISLQAAAGGGVAIDFPPARRIGFVAVFLLVGVVFEAVAIFFAVSDRVFKPFVGEQNGWIERIVRLIDTYHRAEIVFTFGLIGIAATVAAVSIFIVRVTVVANRDGLLVTRSIFGLKWRSRFLAESIAALTAEVNGGSNGRAYYSLRLTPHMGRRRDIGWGIEGKPLADRVAEALLAAMK